MSHILILGATSGMADSLSRKFAENGFDLYLAGRVLDELDKTASDIKIRHSVQVETKEFDVLDFDGHRRFYDEMIPKPEGIIVAIGYLGNQEKAQTDFNECRMILDTNFNGIVSICNIIAEDFEKRQTGFIIGLSSVAGDRGRKSNYIYGSAKAGLTTYLSGLRGRLSRVGVPVLTVKPGFVRTKMIAGLDLPEKLVGEPDDVAKEIYRAWKKGKHEIYTRWFWRYIMLIIKTIPERFFMKMDL
jgi:decaprenylphospho-beta-D-erythro-pentofuranosid-2-ulose 2-reductase